MEKLAMQLASVASMIDQFNIPNIRILQSLGYKVDVVADFTNPGTITKERADDLKKRLADMDVNVYDIAIPRSLNPIKLLNSYRSVKELLRDKEYSLLHCHSPIGGVIARAAAKYKRKDGLKVLYTAHGFHFYDGAPLKNWIVFYPVEKFFSRYTDVLITINKEDYQRALNKLHAGKTVYIPGIGIDTDKFAHNETSRDRIRSELGLAETDTMLLSVGELNTNKNHLSVIKALKGINATYVIVGKGDKKNILESTARELGVDIRLPGFRTDVADFYSAADAYILPSFREGLNASLMEAMSAGLPVACGNIRGNTDLIDDSNCLFNPTCIDEIRSSIESALNDKCKIGKRNKETVEAFKLTTVESLTTDIYKGITS